MDLFAGIPVSDYERALDWYERLLGSPASFRPHETESVWTLGEHQHVYVVLDPDRAGHSLVTLFLEDLEAFVDAAGERAITPATRETYDNGVRKVTYRDPDGNEVGLGGPPVEG
jgi:catechol 2,3-dioxygenase-like lactoylglutathione lyase family enzyme